MPNKPDKPKSSRTSRRRSLPAQSTELAATAHHEAGHAVAHRAFGFKIKQVTIVPSEGALGAAKTKGVQLRRLEYKN
jgi:hypothetical protein